jgi:hypothetical protein
LHVNGGAPDGTLASGTFGGGVDTHIERAGDLLNVQLSVTRRGGGFLSWRFPWAWSSANALDWNCSLNGHIPLVLNIETASGQTELDLGDMLVSQLILKTTASVTCIALPAYAGQTLVTVEASAASVEIHVPQNVAASVRTDNAMASIEADLNRFKMVKDGREYRSEAYDTATHRAEIRLELAVSSIKII